MPYDLGRSWANINGNSVGWLENCKNFNATYLSAIYIGRNQNSINNIKHELISLILNNAFYAKIRLLGSIVNSSLTSIMSTMHFKA